jgi:hypothetical protein
MRQYHPLYYNCGMKVCNPFNTKVRCWFLKEVFKDVLDKDEQIKLIDSMKASGCKACSEDIWYATLGIKTKW